MAFLGKEYILVKQENFDGFLRSAGLPEEQIAALCAFKPSQKIVKNSDNTYTITTTSPKGARETTMTPGVEFEETIGLNAVVKSTYTIDGNTVTQTIKNDKGTGTFKKEFNGDDLVVTISSDIFDGVAHRYYKA